MSVYSAGYGKISHLLRRGYGAGLVLVNLHVGGVRGDCAAPRALRADLAFDFVVITDPQGVLAALAHAVQVSEIDRSLHGMTALEHHVVVVTQGKGRGQMLNRQNLSIGSLD